MKIFKITIRWLSGEETHLVLPEDSDFVCRAKEKKIFESSQTAIHHNGVVQCLNMKNAKEVFLEESFMDYEEYKNSIFKDN